MAERWNYDVFISYARSDSRWAEKIAEDLRGNSGLRVFLDRESAAAGDRVETELERALQSARHLVVVWTPAANESLWVKHEVERFHDLQQDNPDERRILPIWFGGPALEVRGSQIQPVLDLREAGIYQFGPDRLDEAEWSVTLRPITRELLDPATTPRSSSRPPSTSPARSKSAPVPNSPVQSQSRRDEPSVADTTINEGLTDYAIVIGVASYLRLNDLPSAASDARAFVDWLQASDGGAISKGRIALRTFDVESELPATASALAECFEPLAQQVLARRGTTIGRRLYLFASGRGTNQSLDDLALCAPAASTTSVQGIRLKAYADWFMNSGAFQEVVLFADCRPFDTLATVVAASPPFVEVKRPFNETAVFYCASRTVRGPDAERTGVGSFTQALLERLRGEVAQVTTPNGVVSSHAFTVQLSERVAQLSSGTQDAQYIVHGTEIILRPGTETPGRQVETSRAQVTKTAQERVAAHADNPALVDELGRRPFAEVIAQRIDEVRRSTRKGDSHEVGAFVINLHGPWGSGKTSVLNFLKENLQDKERKADERWVVVEFNAWRHQRLPSPWWTLIKQIHRQALDQLGTTTSDLLRARWFWWRLRADWLPAIVTVLLVAIALTAMSLTLVRQGAPAAGDSGIGKAMELGLGVITALLAAGAALVAFSRSLLFGSSTAAQAYMDARSDPLGPITTLFEKLVEAIDRPLVVFIDDLDRCDGSYVIALLEGIQTLFRTRPVTYVIAADRKWICSCFEKRYADFAKTIGEPGRPLGYLFLDKVFQVSASVPRVSAQVQESYWQSLLRAGASTQSKPAEIDKIQREEQRKAEVAVKDVRTVQEGDQKIAEASAQGPVAEQAMRAAVAKQITSPEAMQETEHRLKGFAHLLEANPRAMKRLVNAYGLYQAAHILERRQVSPEALARWTIVELRWPLLAEHLAMRPQLLNGLSSSLPKSLKNLFDDCEVKAVLTGTPPTGDVLDENSLRTIVGSGVDTREDSLLARASNAPAYESHGMGGPAYN